MARNGKTGGRRRLSGVTTKDIAQRCGVSKITVGRAFSRPDLVRPETRERIVAAAREMGYVYNALAATLVRERKPFIGLVASQVNDSQAQGIIRASQQIALENDIDVLLGVSELDPGQELTLINRYVQYQAAGIAIYGPTRFLLENPVEEAARAACPLVVVGEKPEVGAYGYIGYDLRKAAFAVTEYLIRFGHKNIGLLCGPHEISGRAYARYLGYMDAMRLYGLEPRPEQIFLTASGSAGADYDRVGEGYRAAESFLACRPRPTALIFPSDTFAMGGMIAARNRGVAIPGEVSVVSMFASSISSWLEPALTTIRIPEEDIVKRTIAFFRDLLDSGRAERCRQDLGFELIIRDSCAPPAP